jgi:hypothetical protein
MFVINVQLKLYIMWHVKKDNLKAGFMLERAVCDTERGDTEPSTAFVFTL